MVTAFRFLSGAVIIGLLGINVWLSAWNQAFDAGYGMAMSDVYLDQKSPEQYFKEMTGAKDARRGVPN